MESRRNHGLSDTAWTTIATPTQIGPWRVWDFVPGHTSYETHLAVEAGSLITMHRITKAGPELVARLPCRHWRRIERALKKRSWQGAR